MKKETKELLEQAEAEVEYLLAKGWTKQNFAKALKEELEKEEPQQKQQKSCEKCGRILPVDCPTSVYACTMGTGCADYTK